MKTMNKTKIAIVGVVTLAGLIAFYLYVTNNRFYISPSAKGLSYKIDKRTGKTWILRGGTMHPVTDPEPEKPAPQLRSFPPEERSKITGNAGLQYGTLFQGKLYNGSKWYAREVYVTITAKESDGSLRWSRQFKDDIFIGSLSTECFQIQVTGAKGAQISWVINDVKGYPDEEHPRY